MPFVRQFIYARHLMHQCVSAGKGFAAGLSVALTLLALYWAPAACDAELVDRIAAVVNDDIILLSDIETALAPWRSKMRQDGYSETQMNLALTDHRPQLLEQLINQKLTDQQIKRDRINVTDFEVDATIERITAANKMSKEQLQRMLDLDGINYDEYRRKIKEQLLRTKLVNREVKSKIVLTEEDIRAYYDQHSSQYAGSTGYHLRHILIRIGPSAGEDDKTQARSECLQILERLRGGEDFAQMAQVHSQAPTAAQGGDLGTFEMRLLAAEIQQALKGLEAGQITGVVDTEQGYQIFKIEEIVRRGGKTLEEARAEIEEKLFSQIVEQKYQSWLQNLRQNSHIEVLN